METEQNRAYASFLKEPGSLFGHTGLLFLASNLMCP